MEAIRRTHPTWTCNLAVAPVICDRMNSESDTWAPQYTRVRIENVGPGIFKPLRMRCCSRKQPLLRWAQPSSHRIFAVLHARFRGCLRGPDSFAARSHFSICIWPRALTEEIRPVSTTGQQTVTDTPLTAPRTGNQGTTPDFFDNGEAFRDKAARGPGGRN